MTEDRAEHYLTTWALRMRPAAAPFDKSDAARTEWRTTLANVSTTAANGAWHEWQNTGATRWPNLYQFQQLLRKHADTEDLAECPACLSQGWIAADDEEHNGHTYSAVIPCHCEHGQRATRSTLWRERTAPPKVNP